MDPRKYLMQDLLNKSTPFDVWLQGKIIDILDNNIILSDSTGKVKVTECHRTDGVIGLGAYCCVIGVAVKTSDIPEVSPTKFFTIQSQHEHSWKTEVQEAQCFLKGQVAPKI